MTINILNTMIGGSAPPTPTPTPSPGGTSLTIYDDALNFAWYDGSWDATLNMSNTSPVYDGTYSVSYTATAGWAGFQLQNRQQAQHRSIHVPSVRGALDHRRPEIRGLRDRFDRQEIADSAAVELRWLSGRQRLDALHHSVGRSAGVEYFPRQHRIPQLEWQRSAAAVSRRHPADRNVEWYTDPNPEPDRHGHPVANTDGHANGDSVTHAISDTDRNTVSDTQPNAVAHANRDAITDAESHTDHDSPRLRRCAGRGLVYEPLLELDDQSQQHLAGSFRCQFDQRNGNGGLGRIPTSQRRQHQHRSIRRVAVRYARHQRWRTGRDLRARLQLYEPGQPAALVELRRIPDLNRLDDLYHPAGRSQGDQRLSREHRLPQLVRLGPARHLHRRHPAHRLVEWHTDANSQPDPVANSEPDPVTDTKPDAEPDTIVHAKSDAVTEPDTIAHAKSDAVTEPDTIADAQPDSNEALRRSTMMHWRPAGTRASPGVRRSI